MGDEPARSAGRARADDHPAFHELLLRWRTEANASPGDLAAALGLSVKAYRTYERPPEHASARTPPADVARRLFVYYRAQGLVGREEYNAFLAARTERRARERLSARPAMPRANPPRPALPGTLLPRQRTALVGRAALVDELCALLREPDVALVTLLGTGGVGKTRLALEVASRSRDAFPDGVRWVELAAVAAPETVAASITAQLGVTDPPTAPPRDRLLAWCANKTTLLVLDNFEQVLPAALLVADLLAQGAGLTVLVTSRAPLHLHGEQERVVPPLERAAAARLFVRRVRDSLARFAETAESAAAIDALCARLDDVPLALELAARQLRRYGTAQALLASFPPALPHLVDGPLDAPARQQTMRATIAWSYDLLPGDAQRLLRRLAVCRGGCTPAAARALGQNLPDVGGAIAALVDHGLVQRATRTRQERLSLFEVVREYGLEQLAAMGEEEDEARRRHAEYYLALAEEAESSFQTPQQAQWDRVLVPEHDNLRAALEWTIQSGAGTLALRLVAALRRHWLRKGQTHEARYWADGALASARDVPAELRARGLVAAAQIASEQNDAAAAERLAAEGHALAVTLGDAALLGDALNTWGALAGRQGDYGRASVLHGQALAAAEAAGSVRGIAESHHLLGTTFMLQWDATEAEAHLKQAGALLHELGDVRGYGLTLFGVGVARTMVADFAGALPTYREALTLARRLGDPDLLIYVVYGIAAAVGLTGDPERSARLFGAAARLCEDISMELPPSFRSLAETTQGMVRGAMAEPEAFDRWVEEGQALAQAETLALARRGAQEAQARVRAQSE